MQETLKNILNSAKSLMSNAKSAISPIFSSKDTDENPYDFNAIKTKHLTKAVFFNALSAAFALLAIFIGSSTPFGFFFGFIFGYSGMNAVVAYLSLRKHLKKLKAENLDGGEKRNKKLSVEEQLAEDAEKSRKIIEEHQHMAQREMDPETQSVMNALFAAAPEREEKMVETVEKEESTDFNSIFKR